MVSGHVQIPLQSALLLQQAGHEVHIISTPILPGHVLPECLPPNIALHQLHDASRQGDRLTSVSGRTDGFRPVSLGLLIRRLNVLMKRLQLDVLHFFGGNRTANLAGLVKLLNPSCRIVATTNAAEFPEPYFSITRHLWRKIDRVITATEFFRNELRVRGIPAHIVRHGIVKNIRYETRFASEGEPRRILFWREATPRNGGDIAVGVFKNLAPKHPTIKFDFALRPHWNQHTGVKELAENLPNVSLYQAPYQFGITLEGLLAESICVLQPFRSFTIQPQLSILESLLAGVPVIASDVQSTREIVQHERTGFIVSSYDVTSFTSAVERMILDRTLADKMKSQAASATEENWNWDSYVSDVERLYDSIKPRE